MKKNIFFAFIVLALSFFLFNISPSPASTVPGAAIIKMLPESTEIYIQCASLQEMFDYFSVTGNTFWGKPIEDLEDIQSELGFNPFDLNEFRNNGFDVAKPFGIAMSDIKIVEGQDEPGVNLLLFLPAKDSGKAMAWMKKSIEKKNKSVKFQKQGDMWQWGFEETPEKNSEGQPEDQANKEKTNQKISSILNKNNFSRFPNYMMSKKGYLLLGTNPAGDAKAFFESIGNGKKGSTNTLLNAPKFLKTLKKLNAPKDILFYADLERTMKQNPEYMEILAPFVSGLAKMGMGAMNDEATNSAAFQLLKDYRAVGATIDLKSGDFKVGFYADIIEKSKMFNLFKDIHVQRDIILGLKENPVLLMGVSENMQAYWQMLQESLDSDRLDLIRTQFAKIKSDYGIDMETDVINNLGSNFNAGIYDGMSINMGNINALISLEFKQPAKMRSLIEKLIGKMPEQQQTMVNRLKINGNDVYMLPIGPLQLYAGFKGNDLLITLGKPMFEKALNGDPAKGFMGSVQDKQLRNDLKSEISVFYIDIEEIFRVVKNFMPMLMAANPDAGMVMTPEFQKVVNMFQYISLIFKAEKDAVMGDFVIKTTFNKPFFKGIKDVSERIEAMKNK